MDLSYCEVSNVGAKARAFDILKRFSSNSGRSSQICCLQALAKALQRNTTLTDLRFYGCEIDDFGVEARVLQLSIFH